MLACRSTDPLEPGVRDKLALFCQVPPDSVLGMHDVSNIWQVRPCSGHIRSDNVATNHMVAML